MAYGQQPISPSALAEMIAAFRHQLSFCRLSANESLAVITDSAFHPHYAAACFGAGLDLGANVFQVILPQGKPWSEPVLRSVFAEADLIVYSTTHALHYAEAMREALDGGKRALMAVVPPHVLQRRVADPALIRRAKFGAELLDRAQHVRVTSDAGTDLVIETGGLPGVATYGVADEPGHLDFWGGGFFQKAIQEGGVEGSLVLDTGDQIFHFARYVDRPVRIAFEAGRICAIEGGVEAHLIRTLLDSYDDPKALLAGHMAFGADPRADWTAEGSQFPVTGGGGADAEAAYGNVQIEIGSNNDVMFRGSNATRAHLGLCALNCSVWLDEEPLLDHGEYVPPELRATK